MGTARHVGTTDPAQPAIARYVHGDGHPSFLIPRRRGIRASTTRRGTNALLDAIPIHDRKHLGPGPTPGTRSFPGRRPVAGIGMTLDDTARTHPLSANCRRPG